MSNSQEKPKTKAPTTVMHPLIQAVKESTILPTEGFAKAEPTENTTANTSELQAALKQCEPLPKKRLVAIESVDRETKQATD